MPENERVIGQLEGKFEGLERQVKSIKTEMVAKEARDQVRHDTLIRRTDTMADKIFNKVSHAVEESHSVPCLALADLQDDIHGKNGIRDQLKEIKTTGRVGWRAILLAGSVVAFLATVAIMFWAKGQ